ncbi:hypothetical protein PU630_10485 [Microbacterium horticulturae]|uniref:Uncharacterized protein n=1 Tax=Microbacterium horticulturae TaxID=3028316 RepID=A0ABY8BV04_9MICO|nr:hypothetical protein [Microbacterium sp. KACC 23027]WEG07677.1 hypothetical protein PU630_10485 [Microbacterium sp. KACC 23027]
MEFFPGADVLLTAALSIFLFLALCAALVLIVVSLRHPSTTALLVAGILVVIALVIVALAPVNVPAIMGVILTALGIAVAVIGGNPVARRLLEIAAGARVRETEDGGIVVVAQEKDAAPEAPRTLMRGGTVIGYLERLAAVISIVVGYPEAIAVVVAIKGIGRFSELGEPETRERFIIGTLASLVWACAVGALLRLAVW